MCSPLTLMQKFTEINQWRDNRKASVMDELRQFRVRLR
ncbi:hypothetical protein BIW11_03056 [Tropilaelaps mercedesae]|uniref:Uncharacterized protein n=1 Tax=Tropilaelaps mercedesae TaxID=418985 RepID=A0A1V9XSQ9_9ACAR|nr:hypothetical protein BIW11_03056 [Tropilaelaps mercedesae]